MPSKLRYQLSMSRSTSTTFASGYAVMSSEAKQMAGVSVYDGWQSSSQQLIFEMAMGVHSK